MSVQDIDLGYSKIMNAFRHDLNGTVIAAGVQAEDKAAKRKKGKVVNTDIPLVVVAAVHEFGSANIPQRSFLSSTYDENKSRIETMAENVVAGTIKNISTDAAVNQLGNVMQGMIQKKIVNGPFTPLKPATIKRKGSSKPLIDTDRLRQSIRYVVMKGGNNDE